MAAREYTNSSFSSFTNAGARRALHFSAARARACTGIETFLVVRRTVLPFPLFFLRFFPPPPFFRPPHTEHILFSERKRENAVSAVRASLVLSFLSLFLSLSFSVQIRTNLQTRLLLSHAFHVMFFLSFRRLKLDCEKLANDKIEIQRHYVMVSAIIAAS